MLRYIDVYRGVCGYHKKDYDEKVKNKAHHPHIIPVDLPKIAEKTGSDQETLYQMLYYKNSELVIKEKCGNSESSTHWIFTWLRDEYNAYCINFPYLSALLAEAEEEESKNNRIVFATEAASEATRGAMYIACALLIIEIIKTFFAS